MTRGGGGTHHRPGGGFQNPWVEATAPAFGNVLKWLLVHRTTRPLPKDPPRSVFRRTQPSFAVPRAAADRVTVTWVGHASVLLQLGGMNVLTDPVWSARASPAPFLGPRRWVPPGVAFEDLPPVDLVLQSHNHYDHLDSRTVRRIARAHPEAPWLVPLGLAAFVRRRGVRRVTELDWGQEADVGVLRVSCTPAQHFSGRGFRDRGATLWCGWALAAVSGRRVFFAGDTGHHSEFGAIGARYGPFDLALLPIGAYEPRWFMRYVHMNPEEAVAAFRALGARAMVPIHWGTFKLTDEAMDEPPARARAAWQAAGLPASGYRQLLHGETWTL
ncbi:MAG TPA: MBL fold metallo-hydrolase [Gemmatimonadales bacterium]|nr:MBL fold metallo-hydrolase [Gemmatimonadales bacterium]